MKVYAQLQRAGRFSANARNRATRTLLELRAEAVQAGLELGSLVLVADAGTGAGRIAEREAAAAWLSRAGWLDLAAEVRMARPAPGEVTGLAFWHSKAAVITIAAPERHADASAAPPTTSGPSGVANATLGAISRDCQRALLGGRQ